ncbi:MAG TPA: sigma factor, partial [Actinomycetota bacterium]
MSDQAGVASVDTDVDASSGARTFEAFYTSERDRLYGALCLITGNRHEAEELTQDSFLSLWERWDRVRDLESPTGYLYRTAMNAFRSRRRRAGLAIRHAFVPRERQDAFEVVDDRDVLLRVLATLTRRQRAAV